MLVDYRIGNQCGLSYHTSVCYLDWGHLECYLDIYASVLASSCFYSLPRPQLDYATSIMLHARRSTRSRHATRCI